MVNMGIIHNAISRRISQKLKQLTEVRLEVHLKSRRLHRTSLVHKDSGPYRLKAPHESRHKIAPSTNFFVRRFAK